MFTTSQKMADAKINTKIFLSLFMLGLIAGVFGWVIVLPHELSQTSFVRVIWALISDPVQRAFWENHSHLFTRLWLMPLLTAISLPLLVGLQRKRARTNPNR